MVSIGGVAVKALPASARSGAVPVKVKVKVSMIFAAAVGIYNKWAAKSMPCRGFSIMTSCYL